MTQPRRVAIVGGNRIPFARSNTVYATASNQEMLTSALDGLVERFNLHGERLGEVVAGAVLKHSRDFNLTREYNQGGSAGPQAEQLSITRGIGNHFWVAGSLNSYPVQFLVDTGATSVAMNEGQARRLGIDYRVVGRPMVASTAGGNIRGWRIKLDRVKVGSIEVLGVEGVVLEGDAPTEVLLGMSFLSRVRWREENGVLLLESKI